MPKTSIEWTDVSWPVVNGCRRVSAGCERCYAERLAATRLSKTEKYRGLAVFKKHGPQWTGATRLWPKDLAMPLRLRKPSRIFVADMGDLFYEGVSNETIAAVFGVMAASPKHVFQVLTKRPERAKEWFAWVAREVGARRLALVLHHAQCAVESAPGLSMRAHAALLTTQPILERPWPLPNVHIGTSVENQETADERIPELLRTPAAVRFVSYEPALGPVDFSRWLHRAFDHCPDETADPETDGCRGCPAIPNDGSNGGDVCSAVYSPALDWIIVGGESGPRARPFDVEWARSVVEQCKAAGVAVFVKQLGRVVRRTIPGSAYNEDAVATIIDAHLIDRKGGDMAEWPADLRVREYPKGATP